MEMLPDKKISIKSYLDDFPFPYYVIVRDLNQLPLVPNYTSIQLEDRYLVWNGVGIVTSYADGANGAIDVKFHDASVHHSLHILNYNNHNMASLSSTALVLAGEDSAKLVIIALAASGNKEWSIQLPEEDVVAVVATSKLIAVGTSMQREIIPIPGSVIYLSGFENRIMLSYHAAPACQKQRNITAMLLHAKFKVQKYYFCFNAWSAIGTAGI
uniref:WDHD1/CFT4 second beta-propeller domain-containing protein n=1 Tax=Glossina palpalis gambiensis TaxID=67801 RepID=A0A1B0BFA9_9MUSC